MGYHVMGWEQIPISELKYNIPGEPKKLEFQRVHKEREVKAIQNSIENNGYWEWETVLIDQNYNVVNGQGKVHAALLCGMETVPCCRVWFDTEKDKLMVYERMSSTQKPLNGQDKFTAREGLGDPYTILTKMLYDRPTCLWHNKVDFNGTHNGSRFPLSSGEYVLNTAMGIISHTTEHIKGQLRRRAIEILSDEFLLERTFAYADRLITLLHESFGPEIKENGIKRKPYESFSIRAFCHAFNILSKDGHLSTNAKWKHAVAKLGKINQKKLAGSEISRLKYILEYFHKDYKNESFKRGRSK